MNDSSRKGWLPAVAIIWLGFALTSFAATAASYAAVWYVTETTGSPLALALVYVLAFLPFGLLAPLGGLLADRFNRRSIVIVCDSFIAATALVLAFIIELGHVSLPLILVIVTLFGIAQAFRQPAFNAAMPLIVPEEHLLKINMLDNILSSISLILAPALGIFLYTTLGFQAVMFLDAGGALAAALAMFAARIPTSSSKETHGQGVISNLKQGLAALVDNKGVFALVLGVAAGMMAYGPIDSLLPLMVSSHFSGDGYMAALVTGVFGAGLLVGSMALMALGKNMRLVRVITTAAFVVGVATTAAGLLPSTLFPAYVAAMGIMACACAGFNGPLMTILQKSISEDKLGRVMGLFSALMGLSIPLGTALGGMLAEEIGVAWFFVVDGVIILALGIALAALPSVRKLDAIRG